ncbi:aminotransferase class V-fold PLP-dependent enzyme [Clostridia bacterium]|nr:aminotransferase class V-fold PLP-dependent enzyme [Clostridia bacterium]
MNVYLDYAATSFKKPACVLEAMNDFLVNHNANPGRGGYERSLEAGRRMLSARQTVADFFSAEREDHVVFAQNVTMALNMAIQGLADSGDHVIISGMEHNAVYRPVYALAKEGKISYDVIPASEDGITDPEDFSKCIKHNTKMIVVSHASNVCGNIFPLEEVVRLAKERNILTIVDTAQTAGVLPLTVKNIDVLAFTGHKHLLGPNGTGGFVLSEEAAHTMKPILRGGTGSLSHLADQPDFMPDKFESGTLNTVGIMGLKAGMEHLLQFGISEERKKEMALTSKLLEGMKEIGALTIYGTMNLEQRTGTVAFNMAGVDNSELCYVLDKKFGIMGRPGLHCSPLGHQTLGTYPEGVMRFSVGNETTMEEIEYTIDALKQIGERL